jgi:hypothetical protein
MVILLLASIFSPSDSLGGKLQSAFWWAASALFMGYSCMRLWGLGRAMGEYQVRLEPHGVTFNLGTRKKPADLFLPWDQIAAITSRRIGNTRQFWVQARNGSEATFSSYTFFRPMKVARMIGDRSGLTVQYLK